MLQKSDIKNKRGFTVTAMKKYDTFQSLSAADWNVLSISLAFISNPFTQCQKLFVMISSCLPRFWRYFVIFVYSASPCSTSGSACTARSGSFYHFSWHRYLNLLYQNNILVKHNSVVTELIQIYTTLLNTLEIIKYSACQLIQTREISLH